MFHNVKTQNYPVSATFLAAEFLESQKYVCHSILFLQVHILNGEREKNLSVDCGSTENLI
jgi:hypothetical protein